MSSIVEDSIRISNFFTDAEKKEGAKKKQHIPEVTILFSGDSGDGIQLIGSRFSSNTAFAGNDLATFPNFPAEIRAPSGTIAGISGFQIRFSEKEIFTPGDKPDILVVFNPAALMGNIQSLKKNGIIIWNKDSFTEKNFAKINVTEANIQKIQKQYKVIEIPISSLTEKALDGFDMNTKQKLRCKNMFALGIVFWIFHRKLLPTKKWIESKFADNSLLKEANLKTLNAGYNYAETTEILPVYFVVHKQHYQKGVYKNITGNEALALGLTCASQKFETPLLYASYPITPASDILHQLSQYKQFGIRTLQAEDEIAACCLAIGAGYSGNIGVTASSGPGISLKLESINLAIMAELPLLVINVQRAGPSTGMPTKTEQSDLLQAFFGRHGESPLVIIAARTPSDCFYKAIEAVKIAVVYRTPVIFLSDAFLASTSSPWKLPDKNFIKEKYNFNFWDDAENFSPYMRDTKTFARSFPKLGTPGLEHRIGSLEKENITGNISYDPINHELMCQIRRDKILKVQKDIPDIIVEKNSVGTATNQLVIGWGSTHGAIREARQILEDHYNIILDQIHIDYLSPFPKNLKDILKEYKKIFVVELNSGNLQFILQATFVRKMQSIHKIQGQPFHALEIANQIKKLY